MPRAYYQNQLTRQEVIELFNAGKYRIVDNQICGRKGKPLYVYTNKKSEHTWVRLFAPGKSRVVPTAHAVWMITTQCVIPDGWEIHHKNTDPTDNSFENLICCHPMDHRKLHAELTEAPF